MRLAAEDLTRRGGESRARNFQFSGQESMTFVISLPRWALRILAEELFLDERVYTGHIFLVGHIHEISEVKKKKTKKNPNP